MQTPEQIIIGELQRLILMQAQEIKLLKARITDLERKVEQNSTRKNSNNSSVPPSKDENRPPRTSSLREKSDRKVGGQPGHEGKTLEMSEDPDEVIEHRACFCPECGNNLINQSFSLSCSVISLFTFPRMRFETSSIRTKNLTNRDFGFNSS